MASNVSRKKDDCRDLIKEWELGKEWIDGFTNDFPELMALADGLALTRVSKAPIVGDVTLASAVRQIPRASIQQLPTFSVEVNGTKLSIPAFVCDFLVRRRVFNQDTFGKGILSTMQMAAESGLTLGFQAVVASLGSGFGEDIGTSMKLVHYNDLVIERGVFDAADSGRDKIRTRVTRQKLKRIIKAAKNNPNTTWDVSALEELLKLGPNSTNYSDKTTPPRYNVGLGSDENTFDLITDYENKPFGDVTTFALNFDKPLRKINSKSKFGYPRVSLLVIDPAQLSPFGISRVRLASPAANYANIYLQSTAKMQLLNADPPVFQRGQFTSAVRLKRGSLWQSMDPNADVKLQELSNSTLNQFNTVLQFVASQIYSIMGVTAGSVGAQDTTGAYQNKIASSMEKNVSDLAATQVTNIIENFLRQYALTALDLYVSEQVGDEDLIVDDQCKNSINQYAESKFVPQLDPMTGMPTQFVPPVGDDNVVKITWEELYESIKTWTVDIDLSMSKDTLDEKKRADAQDMLTVISQTSDPNDPVAQARKRELEDTLLKETLPEVERMGSNATQQMPVQPQEQTDTPY